MIYDFIFKVMKHFVQIFYFKISIILIFSVRILLLLSSQISSIKTGKITILKLSFHFFQI